MKIIKSMVLLCGIFCFFQLASNDVIVIADNFDSEIEENKVMTINVILDPLEKVEVYPEIFEEVETIPFRLGESFKKGDLLLKMKNQFYASLVKKTAKALEYAEEDLRIKESLYKDKLISTLEILKAETELATAKNNLDDALKNYQATLVIAPFDGKIGAIHVRKYERPIRQKSMMEFFNDKKIIAKFIVPAQMLSQFTIGQTIPILVKDLNKTFQAKVIRIGAEINPISLTISIEAEIDNTDGTLIPGMASFFHNNLMQ